uniref:transposase n=1 Tax=Staphylococcus aureus TaxID=1280 RepID=UPI0018FE1FFD
FPNAAIIFDRFHIVQHLNRELNKYRVQVMNEYRNKKGPNYTIYYPAFNNGAIEGINNKIKLIKRISFGYRNFNNFKARIMMIFSLYKGEKKKTTKPNNGLAA